ncbi:SDR family oxidoreductase [Planktomarina sp.]|nr:SDR family oxidoreductase [Planktomarina sp.]
MITALVTGGTTGIGGEVVDRLLSLGYGVSYTSRKTDIEDPRTNAIAYNLDLCDTSTVDELVATISNQKKQFDLIILNAGYTEFVSLKDTLDSLSPETFDLVIRANLTNNYRLLFGLAPLIRPNGHVILISSVAAYTGIGSNLAYTLSKQCLKTMAAILAKNNNNGLRFNAVAPGLTKTNFTEEFPDEYFESYRKDTPLDRLATVNDIADAVISLETEMKFVNGQTILVDGGYY